MTPSNGSTPMTKTTQKTVFDLDLFQDVLLKKEYVEPVAPVSLEAALEAVGNDQSRLLKVIHDGLKAEANSQAYNDKDGWNQTDEEGDIVGPYEGKSASAELGKKIDAAVLTLAKLNGYEKSLSPAKKQELKANAIAFIRSNPAILENIKAQAS